MKCRKHIVTLLVTLLFFCSTLTVTAEEQQSLGRAYVKVESSLNLREGPSISSMSLSKLKPGDLVDVLEVLQNGWARVKTETGEEGYVSGEYIVIPDIDTTQYELISVAVITSKKSSEDRNFNMAKACEEINGILLDTGGEFNWYGDKERGIAAVVGPANEENGYKKANIILNGKYVKGFGGGVCQVSTAVYNCIYKIGIEPTEHHNHSKASSYVEKGMDATVAYPNKNFVFINTCEYPIMFEAYTDGGQVVVAAYKVLQ
ncbi:MAG: SH3 domain-containing protein [Clostridia bacterium]|nr:SH3 domain-containing protein [Clostridia bacterium]